MDKWLLHLEKTRKKMQHYNEKEMPKYMTFYYYYISNNNEIEKIKRQKYKPRTTTITSGELLRTICERRHTSYILDEILLFQQEKMTPLPLTIEDIEIKPSLFIYHDVNCIFFIFRQRRADSAAAKTRRATPSKQKKYTRNRRIVHPSGASPQDPEPPVPPMMLCASPISA